MRPLSLLALSVLAACGSEPAASSLGGGGEGGGPGNGSICTPGETIPCFSGSPAANGVGSCVPGVRVCEADGLSHGTCMGEVLPTAETCLTPVDDDCDGEVNESGEGCECSTGESLSCYSGPAETLGVGSCVAGTQTCLGGDLGFGPCAGDVVPQEESCGTTVDESCDGSPYDSCPGEVLAAIPLPDAVHFFQLVPHPDGGIVAVGVYSDTIDLGGGALVHEDQTDALVARFDEDGSHIWSKGIAAQGVQYFTSAVLTPAGGVLLNGFQGAPADYGGGLAIGLGDQQTVIVELDGAGEYVGQAMIEATGTAAGGVTSVLANGDRLLAAQFEGDMQLGDQLFTAPSSGAVVGRLTPLGQWAWAVTLESPEFVSASLHQDPMGGAVAYASFQGSALLNGVEYQSAGGLDGLLVRLDDDGTVQWVEHLTGPGQTHWGGVNVSPNGDITIHALFEDFVSLGGTTLAAKLERYDAAIARFNSEGALLWSKVVGENGTDDSILSMQTSATVVGDGTLSAFFVYEGTVDLGGGEIGSLDYEVVVARLDESGNPVWYRHASAPLIVPGGLYGSGAITMGGAGHTWFTIGSDFSLDFGGGPLPPGQHLLKFSP